MGVLVNDLTGIINLCVETEMSVAHQLASDFYKEISNANPTWKRLGEAMSCLEQSFVAELKSKLLFYVPAERVGYYSDRRFGPGVRVKEIDLAIEHFSNARTDLYEAANCFALERFTACVYHSMRVAEFALVSVAVSANVPETEHRSWDKLLAGIRAEVNKWVSQKVANFKQKEKTYSDFCTRFTEIQKGWRNPVSHVPRVYSPQTAEGMFMSLRTLFNHLKKEGISEVPMPETEIILPEF